MIRIISTDHYITILFSGYSTMPCAPGFFQARNDDAHGGFVEDRVDAPASRHRSGARWSASSAPAARPAPLRGSFLSTFSISPTLPSALMAPSSSIRMSSSLRRFHASFQEFTLAMSCVFDSITVSMIRSLLARSEEPVSVTSTMASASSGGFTSVAPQLNSTLAVTPWDVEIPLGGRHQLGGDDLAFQILDRLERRGFGHGQHPAHFAEALLGVDQIGDGLRPARRFPRPSRGR